MAYDFHIREAVERNGGNGSGSGKILERFTSKVRRWIDSSEVTRDGSDNQHASLIELDDGDRVLKSSTELN